MATRVSDRRFNIRKLQRDAVRQVVAFDNLLINPTFQSDLKVVRNALQKTFGDTVDFIQENWQKCFRDRVEDRKESLFRELKKTFPKWSSFKPLSRASRNQKTLNGIVRRNISRTISNDLVALSRKWHIRLGDATAIVYGNDYPPYFCKGHDFLQSIGGRDKCEGNRGNALKLRMRPEPKRSWWKSRIKNKSLERSIRDAVVKGKRIIDIYNSLPDMVETSYDTLKKRIYRKRKRAGL